MATQSVQIDKKHGSHWSRRLAESVSRRASLIQICSFVAIVIGLFLIMRTLPVETGVNHLQGWVDGLGFWGPLTFGAIYVIAAVFFVPGALLTLTAGAIFGLFWGLVTVSLASTTAAAVAFLIGRYLARGAVQQQAAKYPKFRAIDRAIGQEGWKIVALLRLAPVFPFSVGNYLLGLTAVRFWPYVLASWIAMLPGTFVWIYLGYLGRAGVEAAGDATERTVLEWVMLVVGFIAVVVLVVFVVRFALRALRQHADLDAEQTGTATAASGTASPWKVIALAATAVVVLVLGACAALNPNWLSRFFGPPAVVMVEAYQEKPDGPVFDHSRFDRLLSKYVSDKDGGGWIDHAAFKANDRDALQAYIEQLASADFDALGRDEKLALLINAYNAFTIELIFEYWDDGNLQSIRDIPSAKRWDDERWRVGENVWSLNQIEHEQIRPKFREPRIHWALVCAAIGCPPLRTEAYTGDRLDEQLDDQGRIVHTHERWFRYDREAGIVHLTELYNWYAGDYEQVNGGVLEHAAKYVPQLRADLEAGRRPTIRWIEYDWDLNDIRYLHNREDAP